MSGQISIIFERSRSGGKGNPGLREPNEESRARQLVERTDGDGAGIRFTAELYGRAPKPISRLGD